MPALDAFGRRWHIASDDLPLPMLSLMTVHTVWCIVVSVAYVGAYDNLHTCPHGFTFGVYMLGVIFVFAAAWSIELAIYLYSMKGTMFQQNERAIIPTLLMAHLVVTLVDVAFSVLGVVLGAENNLFDRLTCFTGHNARNAVLVVIIGNWVVLFFTFLVVQSVFNMFSGIEVEESWKRRLQLLGNLLRVFGVSGLVGADTDPMTDAARAFARVFKHIDFVPSDFATSLVLVGISHAEEQRRREEEEWGELRANGAGGPGAAGDDRGGREGAPLLSGAAQGGAAHIYSVASDPNLSDDEDGGGVLASLSSRSLAGRSLGSMPSFAERVPLDAGTLYSSCLPQGIGVRSLGYGGAQPQGPGSGGPGQSPGAPQLSSLASAAPVPAPALRPGLLAQRNAVRQRDPEMEATLSEATHFSDFALAPYGWPLYVWAHPRCGLCDLCCGCGVRHPLKHRSCFSKCAGCGGGESVQDALDAAALVRFANLAEDDILYLSFENSVLGALPYFIARDSKTQSVVLAVRGTLSVADCITDMMYEPAGLDGTLLGSAEGIPPGSMAHNGVLGCARVIHSDLMKHRALHDALELHRGWSLIVTGHSLGAGVATLLGLMLRSWRPELRVWAFSPPGGLLSEALAETSAAWCTSVVLGNDFICRLSMPNLERLRDEMMSCASRCRLPKFTVLRKAAISGPLLRASDVMYPENAYGGTAFPTPEVREIMQRYQQSVASVGPAGPTAHLFPPGRLLHLVRLGRLRGDGTIYLPRWTTRAQLMSRIVVARNMFTNHFPDKMGKELHRLAEALGVPSVETVFTARAPPQPQQAGSRPGSRTPDSQPGSGGRRSGAATPERLGPGH